MNKSYDYDAIGRLTSATIGDKTKTYTYDAVGNRTTMADDGTTYTYHYNQFNQLTSTEKGSDTDYASYEYDSRGNQTQEQIKKDFDGTEKTQTTEYTYNLLNRMTSATVTATGETTQTVSNTYNAQGQRIKKLENGGTTNYYYVGDEVQFTTTQNAFMFTENVLSPDGNIIASKRFADDNPATPDPYANKYYFYNYDLRGSVTSIIKPDGSRVKDYTYDEFGKLEAGGEQGFLNETTYTGSVKDKSTGLQYMNARYYEPETGRFLTQDTYTGNPYDPWTQHLYSYCGNNPTSMVDPTGHWALLFPEAYAAAQSALSWAITAILGLIGVQVYENSSHHTAHATHSSSYEYVPQPTAPPAASTAKSTTYSSTAGVARPMPGPAPVAMPKATPNVAAMDTPITGATVTEADRTKDQPKGEIVYRVFGGSSGLWGRSWTNVNPRSFKTYEEYDKNAGLPNGNTGEYLATGILYDKKGVILTPAQPLDGKPGGIPEYFIPEPIPVWSKIHVIEVEKLDKW